MGCREIHKSIGMTARCLAVAALLFAVFDSLKAQEIEAFPNYYSRDLINQQRPMPFRYVRENDVVWETGIWRTIDLRERFNQFFYYPLEPEGSQGRKNFAYMIWDAILKEEIQIYQDDEFKIPIDIEAFVAQFLRADTIELEIVDDDDNYEYKSVVIPKEFTADNILQLKLKEAYFIGKETTEQAVRIIGLAVTQEQFKERDGQQEYIGQATLFWIPMLSPQTRLLLSQREAYYEDNIAHLPTWEEIFNTRRFSSYITRESNRFNRSIQDYLTGEDAIWEAEMIELKILNISQDMWEY